MKHVLAVGAIAGAALALCTACAGSSTASSGAGSTTTTTTASAGASSDVGTVTPTGGASSTSTSTTTATTAGSTSGSGSGSGSGNSGLSTCLPRYLNASVANGQGTAGSVYVDLVFKNLNNAACTLAGYPGVSFGAGKPVAQVGQPADRNSAVTPSTVTLQPGGYAYAVLQIGDAQNWPASTCQPTATTYLQVIAPNTTNTLYVAYNSTACKGDVVTMHVEAVQPGSGA